MKPVTIIRRERFSSAHKLWNPDWDAEKNESVFGGCSNPNWHGHNYELIVKVAGEILEAGEFEIAFLTQVGVEAEATTRTVVLLETEISEALAIEGMARELIRTIQDARKSNGFEVSDRVKISYQADSEIINNAFEKFEEKISKETLTESIYKSELSIEEIEIDGEKLKILVEKI